tara:strand:- start:870 stop:1817 length:948 start_codon:yes stop_codon:yes gene_type:complete
MRVILLGYNGFLGRHILAELVNNIKKNNKLDLICIGRDIRTQPFKNKKVKYIKWNFIEFTKSKLYFLEKENIIINCVGKNHSTLKNLKNINVIFIEKLINYIKYNRIRVRFIHLGSVSVYGAEKKYTNKIVNITENSQTNPDDSYSKSKLESELCIKNFSKNNKKTFSFTILRIANVFSGSKNSLSFKLIHFLLKTGIWFKCSDHTNYHYIHAKDVALAVMQSILYFHRSKNRVYNVSDDINQLKIHKIYVSKNIIRLLKIPISLKLIALLIKHMILPRIVLNFFLTITSQITYDNQSIKKELNYISKHSLRMKF